MPPSLPQSLTLAPPPPPSLDRLGAAYIHLPKATCVALLDPLALYPALSVPAPFTTSRAPDLERRVSGSTLVAPPIYWSHLVLVGNYLFFGYPSRTLACLAPFLRLVLSRISPPPRGSLWCPYRRLYVPGKADGCTCSFLKRLLP